MFPIPFEEILAKIKAELTDLKSNGKVATYIPELAKVSPDFFGMHIFTTDERDFSFGDNTTVFSIQSISKVFTLAVCLSVVGEKLFDRVGVEPSGNAFNSIVQLEKEKGIPRNPFINPGALVMADILLSTLKNPYEDYLNFIRKITDNENIVSSERVANSEFETGFMNASLVNFLKYHGNINNDVEEVLKFYYFHCAFELSCRDLAHAFKAFADHEEIFEFGEVKLSKTLVKRVNSIMQTCGFYDEAGEFAYKVGLPGKSGVGGGIVAVHPLFYSVAVWSPPLNEKGNSVKGMMALERLTALTGNSIF